MAAPSPSKPPPARRSGDRPNASAGAWGAKATPTTTTTRPSPSNTEQAANPSLQGEGVHVSAVFNPLCSCVCVCVHACLHCKCKCVLVLMCITTVGAQSVGAILVHLPQMHMPC
eukprot:1158254-Pelagomonas_calceolata.AAC.4